MKKRYTCDVIGDDGNMRIRMLLTCKKCDTPDFAYKFASQDTNKIDLLGFQPF